MQQAVLNVVVWVINNWQTVAAYSGLAAFISVIMQYLKRRYKLDQVQAFRFLYLVKLDGPRLVVAVWTLLNALVTLYFYVLNPANAQYIPVQFAFLETTGLYIHRFLVSPLGTRIENALKPYVLALEQVKNAAIAAESQTNVFSPNQQDQTPQK